MKGRFLFNVRCQSNLREVNSFVLTEEQFFHFFGSLQVSCHELVLIATTLEELSVVGMVRWDWEYSVEIATSRLFILQVHQHAGFVLSQIFITPQAAILQLRKLFDRHALFEWSKLHVFCHLNFVVGRNADKG